MAARDRRSDRARSREAGSVVSFDLRFQPNLTLTNLVRNFVGGFYAKIVEDDDVVSRLALATHELLENAIKYGSRGESRLYIEVDRADGRVTVRIWNRARPEHIAALKKSVVELSAGGAISMDQYHAAMRRSAKRPEGAGLGLARICAEAEMGLRLRIVGDRICLTAQTALRPTGELGTARSGA